MCWQVKPKSHQILLDFRSNRVLGRFLHLFSRADNTLSSFIVDGVKGKVSSSSNLGIRPKEQDQSKN